VPDRGKAGAVQGSPHRIGFPDAVRSPDTTQLLLAFIFATEVQGTASGTSGSTSLTFLMISRNPSSGSSVR
jgi:hypothetical protein